MRMVIDWHWLKMYSWVTGQLYYRCAIIQLYLISVGCSHARAYELYVDSIYHRNSFIGVSCPSWKAFKKRQCVDNPTEFMGHDTSTK